MFQNTDTDIIMQPYSVLSKVGQNNLMVIAEFDIRIICDHISVQSVHHLRGRFVLVAWWTVVEQYA